MALVLFDTNILIDALKGYEQALQELAYWDEPAMSAVTWMEVYAGATQDEIPRLDGLIQDVAFEIIHINANIMALAAQIRGNSIRNGPKIALPDAIIMATARRLNLQVVTRNKRDFKGPNVRIPYELVTVTTVKVVNETPPGNGANGPETSGRPKRKRTKGA
jgi:predicted nucleic acid-binding protein